MNQFNILNILAICLGIVPPIFTKGLRFRNFHKLCGCFLCLMIIIVSVNFFTQTNSSTFAKYTGYIIIDIIDISAALIKTVVSIMRLTIFKADSYIKFQTQFLNIADTYKIKINQCRNFCMVMIILNILLTISTTMIVYTDAELRSNGNVTFVTVIWTEFNHYFNVTLVLLVYNYINSFKVMLQIINSNLVTNIKKYKRFQSTIVFWDIHKLRKLYAELTDTIDLFNKLFGWQIFIIYLSLSVTIINFFNIVIKQIFTTEDEYYKLFNKTSNLKIFFCDITWIIAFWIMSNSIGIIGEIATNEAKRTANVCYNLLLDLEAISVNKVDRMLREELILLAHQATYRHPYFSAAGFFNIGHKMLLGLFGTMASYIVVFIQIHK